MIRTLRFAKTEAGVTSFRSPFVNVMYRTNRIERFIIFSLAALMPLQDHVPAVGGFSFIYLLFAALGCYVICCHVRRLERVSSHALFLTAYAFVFIVSIIEFLHPDATVTHLVRIVGMIA